MVICSMTLVGPGEGGPFGELCIDKKGALYLPGAENCRGWGEEKIGGAEYAGENQHGNDQPPDQECGAGHVELARCPPMPG